MVGSCLDECELAETDNNHGTNAIEMFYLNSIEQLENLVGLKEQLEVCLTCSRLLAAIQMLLLHQKLRCDSNKTTLILSFEGVSRFIEECIPQWAK